MIMDSLYSLKCLIEWFYVIIVWCHCYKGIFFGKILKTINWDIQWNMDLKKKILYSFELIIQFFIFFNVNLWYNYLQLIKFRSKKDCLVLLYEVQYNLFFYNVKWTFILTLVWTSHLSKSPSPYCAFTLL